MSVGGMIGGMIGGAATIGLGIDQAGSDAKAAVRQEQLSGAADTYNARQASLKGQFDSGLARVASTSLTSKQNLAFTNSGVDSTSGTAAQVQSNTAALGELDAQTKMNDAARTAWGFKLQREVGKENLQTQLGNINRKETAAILGGLSQFAGGASSGSVNFGGSSGDNSGDGSGAYSGSSGVESAFEGGG